jgi:hypothetical protein
MNKKQEEKKKSHNRRLKGNLLEAGKSAVRRDAAVVFGRAQHDSANIFVLEHFFESVPALF